MKKNFPCVLYSPPAQSERWGGLLPSPPRCLCVEGLWLGRSFRLCLSYAFCVLPRGSGGHMEKPDGLPLPSGNVPLFSWAPTQLKAGWDSTVSGRVGSNATIPESAAPGSSRLCTFLLHCHSLEFSARNSILGDIRKRMGSKGWEKATRFIYILCSGFSFRYFNLTEIRNYNPWMERHWTNSVKPWAPWGCMFSPISGF